ncbi:putative SWEET sugar transporter [Plasmopara halstedii]
MELSFQDIVQILATLSALSMCASPLSAITRIIRQRDVKNASILPFATLWVCNHIWMLYGYVAGNLFPVFTTYAIGDALSVIYLAIYLRYTTNYKIVITICSIAMFCNAAVTFYVMVGMNVELKHSEDAMMTVVGIIAIISSLALYASPLLEIKVVVQTRSSTSLPFAMILAGVINNLLWILYGILVFDWFLIVPCSVNVFFGLVQATLYGVFHPSCFGTERSVISCNSPKDDLTEFSYAGIESTPIVQTEVIKECPESVTIIIDEISSNR